MAGGTGARGKLSEAAVKAHAKAARGWRLAKVEPPAGKSWKLADGGGLFLTVTKPAGTAVWRIKFAYGGKTGKYYAVGTYPDVTLKQARAELVRVRALLEKGTHPVQARQSARALAVASSGNTFAAVKEAWLAKNKPGWSEAHYKTTSETLTRHARKLDDWPIADLSAADPVIFDLIEKLGAKTRDTAKKLRFSLHSIFRYAIGKGFCTRNPAESAIEALPKVRHSGRRPAFLEWAQLGDVLRRASTAHLSRAVHVAHRLCAFTAARMGNIIGAEWSEFAALDADVPAWVVPRSKMKAQDRHHDHRVLLGPAIAKEIREWKRVTGAGRFVFASPADPTQHITHESIEKAYRVTLGLKDKHTPHGWRSAFSTLAKENGFEHDAVDMALDHVHDDAIARRYDRGERLPERIRLASWWCEQLVKAERCEL